MPLRDLNSDIIYSSGLRRGMSMRICIGKGLEGMFTGGDNYCEMVFVAKKHKQK